MKQILFVLILPIICCCSFQQQKQNVIKFDLDVIELCVDSALNVDKGLNTHNCMVDFNKIKSFDQLAIFAFLKRHINFTITNLDSLIKNDDNWIKYGFFNNLVIHFDSIKEEENGNIIIEMSKIKAKDGADGMQIILKRKKGGFQVIELKHTWIS